MAGNERMAARIIRRIAAQVPRGGRINSHTTRLLRSPQNARRLLEASERSARAEGETLNVGELRARLGLDEA